MMRFVNSKEWFANGSNVVGEQLPTLLGVTCSVRLHTLLHVVGSLKLVKRFKPTTPNISFVL